MDYAAGMDVFEGQAYLDEPIKYLRLAKILLVFILRLIW